MTVSSGDSPDYQGYAQWRATAGAQVTPTVTTASPYTAQFSVTNWASTNIYCTLLSGTGVTVVVTWYADPAFTEIQDTQTWVLNQGTILNVTVPNLSAYFVLSIETAEAGNQIVKLITMPQNLAVTKATYLSDNSFFTHYNFSVPASTTLNFPILYLTVGQARTTLVEFDNAAELALIVFSFNEAGQFNAELSALGASAKGFQSVSDTFLTPAYPLNVQIINSDAAAAHVGSFYYQGISQ